eukprot:CAMPEP_0181123900 /NCGR_PEP_ID=MMETSP1071-20121207/26171_1 /TAXON_ID=35127 /ORGANISM="Thalassiosira sp., Strain NH16" /LENGTH=1237 /DNA_ID=CAMNT_0023209123 /DNA_START=98 /DNA_END=3812 /DNA_ORIENTATION=-
MNASSLSHLVLELTATPRPSETDQGNLFVRLSPRTAWRLASFLFASHGDARTDIVGLSSQVEVPDVDFLPLEIVFNQRAPFDSDETDDATAGGNTITVYASYNGGAPASVAGAKISDDIIELPLDLHPSLRSVLNSTSESVVVSVRPISYAPIAERVTFEPLTISDWEMIEMEASVLEDGGLLNQITIVSPGQVFPLRFGRNLGSLESAAWIRVVDEDVEVLPNEKMDSYVSGRSDASLSSDSDFDSSIDSADDEEENSSESARHHQCVRLMAETEVAVIPKPRMQKDEQLGNDESKEQSQSGEPAYSPSDPLRVQPSSSDIPHAESIAEEAPSLPKPPLGIVCVHPSTMIQLPGYHQCTKTAFHSDENDFPDMELLPPMVVTIRKVDGPHTTKNSSWRNPQNGRDSGDDVVVAIIKSSNCTHVGHLVMHPLLRCQLGVTPLADWVSVQVWSESHVLNSITCVRDGMQKIKISKVTIATSSQKRSVNLCNFPDSHLTFPAYESCRNESSLIDDRLLQDDSCTHLPVFGSGSFIPVEYLRSLGLDGLDQHSHDMLILELSPIAAPLDDSAKKAGCLLTNTSCLAPTITARDLKEHFMMGAKVRVEDSNCELLERGACSLMMPISEESTVGFASAIQSVVRFGRQIFSRPSITENSASFASQLIHNHAIMIAGEEGAGKTHLAMTSASQLSLSDMCSTVYLDCKKLQSTSTSIQIILEQIQESFHDAIHEQPSVLILDDLDALIPNVESSGADGDGSIHRYQLNPAVAVQVKTIVDHFLLLSQHCQQSSMQKSSIESSGVVLICTCCDRDSLSTRYRKSGVFHSFVEVPSFDSPQRARFIHNNMFGDKQVALNRRIPHAIHRLGKDTDGYRPKDLKIVAERIVHVDFLRQSSELSRISTTPDESVREMLEFDIASIMESFSPLSQQLNDVDLNSSSLDWTSIGGLYEAKQSLHDIITHPMRFKSVYDNAPVALPSGVLIYGPPGNGKSFIVPLLAKKSKLNLITCRGPELLDRYIGASEAKVRQLFARATAAAPAIIFFDEFDSLAPQRGSDHTGVTDRVVNQLLTLLDGAERSKKASHIFVVAATSRPDKIDKALLRPGRLEKHIYVGYPESLLEWNSLFSSLLVTRDVDEEVSHLQQCGDLFDCFCKDFRYAQDFSAADMKAVLDTAHLLCVHEILDAHHNGGPRGPATLSKRHIAEAIGGQDPHCCQKIEKCCNAYMHPLGIMKEMRILAIQAGIN